MLSWARKRQIIYGGVVALFFVLVIGAPFLSRTIRVASCSDGRQNGTETGKDCGGGCVLLCVGEASEPRAVWQRVFNESGGIASAVLYAENQNKNAGAFDAPYQVKVYDSFGLLIAERRVTATIPPNGSFAVFAPNLFVGERVPVRASFERMAPIVWRRDVLPQDSVRVERLQFSLVPQPRVEAMLVNSAEMIVETVATAVLYDENGNSVGASQTVVDIGPSKDAAISFVWRAPFAHPPVRVEIIPVIRTTVKHGGL